MKTLITFTIAAVFAGSALAQGNFSAPVVQRHLLPPASPVHSEGGLQRGARLGNALEMLNPFAPAEYGSGRDFLTPADEAAARPHNGHIRTVGVGVRLFSLWF